MNNKGSSLLIGIITGLMIFAAGMMFMNFVTPEIDTARTALDCTNSTITDGNKLTCLGTDIVAPYLIISILGLAGGIIASRLAI